MTEPPPPPSLEAQGREIMPSEEGEEEEARLLPGEAEKKGSWLDRLKSWREWEPSEQGEGGRTRFSDRPGSQRIREAYSSISNGILPPYANQDESDRSLGGWRRIGREAVRRKVAMGLIFFLVLVGDANRGLVLPTLQGYISKSGGDATELGMANAGFSLGRLISAPFYGYWMDRRNTGEVVVFSMVVCILANLAYTYATYLGNLSRHDGVDATLVIIITRTVLGAGASVLGVGRAYIAKQTSRAERGPYIAILCALQYAGFTLTAVISMIDFKGLESLSLNQYNLPGFVLVASYIVGLAVLMLVPNALFESEGHVTNLRAQRARRSKHFNSPSYPYLLNLENSESTENLQQAEAGRGESQPSEPPSSDSSQSMTQSLLHRAASLRSLVKVPGIVCVFILLNFTVRAVLATLETLSTYIISYLYTGSLDEAVWEKMNAPERVSQVFTAIGIVGLLAFVAIWRFCNRVDDRVILLCGLSVIALGLCVCTDFKDGQGLEREIRFQRFTAGLGLIWALGYPLSQTVVVSALSKVLAPEQQGLWMGNLASSGSAGRIIAPTLAGELYIAVHSHTGMVPIAVCFVLTVLSCVLVGWVWKDLKRED